MQFLDGHNEIVKYLIGTLDDQVKMRRIEEKLMTSDEFAEELTLAEDELIEQYLDEELSADDRRRFETYFLVTTERKQKLRLSRDLRRYALGLMPADAAAPASARDHKRAFDWRQYFSFPVIRFAALFLVVAGIGYGVWRVGFYQSEVDKGLAELQLAYRGTRPLDSRIVGFDYAPSINERGDKDKKATIEQERAATTLSKALADGKTAKTLYAFGKSDLAKKDLPGAISKFEEAAALDPNNAAIQSDLGTAYLETANITLKENSAKGLELLDKALRNFDRAIELDPKLAEPRFNRAMCLELLVRPELAKKAWNDYLAVDGASQWAEEARQRLRDLEAKRD